MVRKGSPVQSGAGLGLVARFLSESDDLAQAVWKRFGSLRSPKGCRGHPPEAARYSACVRFVPTAPVAGSTLTIGYAVAASTGSRASGGVVLLVGGLWCVQTWKRRHGVRTAATLSCAGLGAFVLSHLFAPAIGAWPSVLLVAAGMAAVTWTQADARTIRSREI